MYPSETETSLQTKQQQQQQQQHTLTNNCPGIKIGRSIENYRPLYRELS